MREVDCAIFSRMTGQLKGDLTKLAMNDLGLSTLAIGDGYNDDDMLERADVGIKISYGTSFEKGMK